MIPFAPYLIVAAAAGGFYAGWQVQEWRHDAEKAEALAEANRINNRRASVSAELGAKDLRDAQQVRTITKVQIQEVTKYVSVSDCPMSPGFRVFHDAAAAGVQPDASRIADAAAVPADVIANTVADNYGTCHETSKRLENLQKWVRDQAQVK